MNVIIPAIFLACLLFCSAEGQEGYLCVEDTTASFCGCRLKDSINHTIMDIKLDFIGNRYADREYTHYLIMYRTTRLHCRIRVFP